MRRALLFLAGLLLAAASIGVIMRHVPGADPPGTTSATSAPTRAEPGPTPADSPNAVADPSSSEPDNDACVAAVQEARALAISRPADDLSRYFAERHLQQALTEAGNGEFDDCLYWAQRAKEEVQEQHHSLKPGETFEVLRADELPARQESSHAASQKPPSPESGRRAR